MSEKIKILYVDDEPDNLVGFKASLRFHYQVITAVTVTQALSVLENHPDIRVIFCDQRMPEKTGVEFFEEVRITYPLPVRILITAYTDIESIINAINKGNIFRYVQKPWTEPEIVSAIEEANKFYQANSMLSIKHNELQKAYNELNKFAYSVSHDIRGPLSGLIGAVNLVREIEDIEEMKDMIDLMGKSLKKLDAYVLSMHDYYSLQRGELKITEINFKKVMDDLKNMYMILAKTNDIEFNIKVNQHESFRSDELPLRIVFTNLLSNAFKFQDQKTINKSVDVSIDVHAALATIQVKDTGIGILGSHVGEIFSLFYRANNQEVGSGFGLYNVKNALLKLNGQIEVNSVLNKGTTFKVTIPSI
ncbi:MAG: hybrid sensor histidine kinase/response regulator [Bacteroidota bacterium]|nr:hybrid sensor histidine kinase/response regulator [Bacteroidota bacterium]